MGGVTTEYLVDTLNPTGYSQVMDETVNESVTRTYAYGVQRVNENQLVGSRWRPSFYGYDGYGNVRFLANSSCRSPVLQTPEGKATLGLGIYVGAWALANYCEVLESKEK